ncbi:MAG TPA: M1 family metallopeptidase [Acidimicrobiales bacterium]|nr:M1 family metallopeptidase [Acidimicrobiales bacterium]
MTVQSESSANPYRLPRTLVPREYRLRIRPHLDQARFDGVVEIEVDIIEGVSSFALNAIELVLQPATVRAGAVTSVSGVPDMDETFETATFTFDDALPIGPATITLAFSGILNDQLRGFYKSTFDDTEGVTHIIATTQLAATDARRAFPCWDDPATKASFQVTLVVPERLAAFANTRELSSTPLGDGTREVVFAPSMIMSSYLVAFVVGPFEASPVTSVAGTSLRVIYPIGKGHLVDWATEAAVHALEFFTDYFAIPYPGDKVDLIAIPDFAAGAMENLGLVTFRETELLIDPASASVPELERVALVVNHELAHMWFGDLVTMDWWEGIWLNEAFATFMESICTDDFRPEWHKWVRFNTSREVAFTVDAQHSTRPIEYKVVSPDECMGMFDVLTYIKGCSVLRMLEQYLGATTFRDGIRAYLNRHAYANAVTKDLWSALEAASGQPVGEIMDTWILQGGFPLVHVDGATVTQEPFSYLPAAGPSAIGRQWKIPLLVRPLDGGAVSKQLLDDRTLTLSTSGAAVVNGGGWGFFRTAYAAAQLQELSARLDELDALERAVLFSDTWASILEGHSAFSDLFTLALGLRDLDEPSAWSVMMHAFDLVDRIVDERGREALAEVVQKLCAPVFARLGWEPREGESSQAGELRAIVISALGHQGRDAGIIAEATRRFDAGLVIGDLADAIVAITMGQGRPGDVMICQERERAAATPQEEQRYLFAPASSNDPAVILATAERAFREVRTQDALYLIGALMRSRLAGERVWRYVTDRQDEALEKFPQMGIAQIMSGVITFVQRPEFAAEVRAFHESKPFPVGQQQVQQMLDLMDVNVAVTQRNIGTLNDELEAFAAR